MYTHVGVDPEAVGAYGVLIYPGSVDVQDDLCQRDNDGVPAR